MQELSIFDFMPDNYTKAVSEPQVNDLIGNGWTVDVVAHIFTYLMEKKEGC